MTNYQKRKEKNDEYRSKIMRFTFQLSLGDSEVREWFEQQPEKGAYLKDLILRDKAERLGYRERKSAEPEKAGDYEIMTRPCKMSLAAMKAGQASCVRPAITINVLLTSRS